MTKTGRRANEVGMGRIRPQEVDSYRIRARQRSLVAMAAPVEEGESLSLCV